MTSSDSGLYEFARIYPDGLEAEIALDLVAANEKLHPQHAFFLHTQEKIRSDESDLELSPSERREPLKRTFLSGYYKLSLDDPVEQPFAQGYLAGRGHSKLSRDGTNEGDLGVHLLLLRRGRRSNGVAAVHARISIHRRSGALMLFGVQEKRPVLYRIHDDSTVSLEKGQGHVLYQKNNSFTVGNLSYRLVFSDFTHEQYLSFLEKRNQVMEAGAFLAPHPSLSAVWRYQDSKKGYVITHGTIAVGRFGWVRAAVDTRTGEPLAVKRQEAKSKYDMEKIEKEHKVGLQFNEGQGLLPTSSYWCEHDPIKTCDRVPQEVFMSSPLATCDFSRLPWFEYANWKVLTLFCGPLKGLCNLHAAGYIHRDVHPGNLLVTTPIFPYGAVLGDFGKTVKAQSDTDPRLGPAHTLAPEVDGTTRYTNKIDKWSFGFVLFTSLAPHFHPDSGQRITKPWHDAVMQDLSKPCQEEFDVKLAQLLRGMLVWNPAKRLSASQALESTYELLHDSSPTPRAEGASFAKIDSRLEGEPTAGRNSGDRSRGSGHKEGEVYSCGGPPPRPRQPINSSSQFSPQAPQSQCPYSPESPNPSPHSTLELRSRDISARAASAPKPPGYSS